MIQNLKHEMNGSKLSALSSVRHTVGTRGAPVERALQSGVIVGRFCADLARRGERLQQRPSWGISGPAVETAEPALEKEGAGAQPGRQPPLAQTHLCGLCAPRTTRVLVLLRCSNKVPRTERLTDKAGSVRSGRPHGRVPVRALLWVEDFSLILTPGSLL